MKSKFGANGVSISLWFNSKDNGHLNPFRPDVHLLQIKHMSEYNVVYHNHKDGNIAIYFKDDSGLLHYVKYGISGINGDEIKETGLDSHLHNNKWYHWSYSSSAVKIMIYINGVLMKEESTGTQLPSPEPTRNYGLIGKFIKLNSTVTRTGKIGSEQAGTNFFDGEAFDIFMFDGGLSQSEIINIMNQGNILKLSLYIIGLTESYMKIKAVKQLMMKIKCF